MDFKKTMDKAIKSIDVDKNDWMKAYMQFTNIYAKADQEVRRLYAQHKGDPAWDEAFRRYNVERS